MFTRFMSGPGSGRCFGMRKAVLIANASLCPIRPQAKHRTKRRKAEPGRNNKGRETDRVEQQSKQQWRERLGGTGRCTEQAGAFAVALWTKQCERHGSARNGEQAV